MVGLGYVGVVAAAELAMAGHDVLGVDIDQARVDALSAGWVPLYEPGLEERIALATEKGLLRFLHRDEVAEDVGSVAPSPSSPPGLPLLTAGPPT